MIPGDPFKSEVPRFPLEFALFLRDLGDYRYFFETGTYEGETSKLVAPHFEQVFTIEGNEERYACLSELRMPRNINFHLGDSGQLLASLLQVLPARHRRAIIFLDAHWIHAGYTADEDPYQENLAHCPLAKELRSIPMDADHIILIDDAHFFTHPPKARGPDAEWLSLDEICALIKGRYVFLNEGMICAVPNRYRDEMREWLKEFWNDSSRIPETRRSHSYV